MIDKMPRPRKKPRPRKLPTKNAIKSLKDIILYIESRKILIAEQRDELREINRELVDIIDCFDRGIEGLEIGKEEIENGIDAISEVV